MLVKEAVCRRRHVDHVWLKRLFSVIHLIPPGDDNESWMFVYYINVGQIVNISEYSTDIQGGRQVLLVLQFHTSRLIRR